MVFGHVNKVSSPSYSNGTTASLKLGSSLSLNGFHRIPLPYFVGHCTEHMRNTQPIIWLTNCAKSEYTVNMKASRCNLIKPKMSSMTSKCLLRLSIDAYIRPIKRLQGTKTSQAAIIRTYKCFSFQQIHSEYLLNTRT